MAGGWQQISATFSAMTWLEVVVFGLGCFGAVAGLMLLAIARRDAGKVVHPAEAAGLVATSKPTPREAARPAGLAGRVAAMWAATTTTTRTLCGFVVAVNGYHMAAWMLPVTATPVKVDVQWWYLVPLVSVMMVVLSRYIDGALGERAES